MFCESYRETLKEAAGTGEQLPAILEAHLGVCLSCHAAFSEEKALFERIGTAIGARVNAEMPASLLARVRQETAATHVIRTFPVPVLACIASGLAIGAIALSFAVRPRVPSMKTQPSPRTDSSSAPNQPSATQEQSVSAPVFVATSRKNRRPPQVALRAEPEVLVSAEEQLGLQHYIASLRNTTAEVPVVKVKASSEIEPLQIASVDVKWLSIEPLQFGESD